MANPRSEEEVREYLRQLAVERPDLAGQVATLDKWVGTIGAYADILEVASSFGRLPAFFTFAEGLGTVLGGVAIPLGFIASLAAAGHASVAGRRQLAWRAMGNAATAWAFDDTRQSLPQFIEKGILESKGHAELAIYRSIWNDTWGHTQREMAEQNVCRVAVSKLTLRALFQDDPHALFSAFMKMIGKSLSGDDRRIFQLIYSKGFIYGEDYVGRRLVWRD